MFTGVQVVGLEDSRCASEVQETMMLAELVTSPGGPEAPPTSTIRPLANFLHSASAMTALATFALGDGRSALVSGSHGGHVHCVEVQFPGGAAARVEDIRVRA